MSIVVLLLFCCTFTLAFCFRSFVVFDVVFKAEAERGSIVKRVEQVGCLFCREKNTHSRVCNTLRGALWPFDGVVGERCSCSAVLMNVHSCSQGVNWSSTAATSVRNRTGRATVSIVWSASNWRRSRCERVSWPRWSANTDVS
jgi:hypothetical protein